MKDEPSKKNFAKYARLSSSGIQMGVIIALFTWLGNYLDHKFSLKTPWWTISLALFGVISGLFLVIREVLKLNEDDEK